MFIINNRLALLSLKLMRFLGMQNFCISDTPGAPRNVRVKDYWSDSITITWEAPEHDGGSPITGYLIEQRDALYPKWAKAASLEADVFHYKAGNLLEGTDYMFQVFAVNKLGPGTEAGQLERPCKAKMPFGT